MLRRDSNCLRLRRYGFDSSNARPTASVPPDKVSDPVAPATPLHATLAMRAAFTAALPASVLHAYQR